MIPYRRIVAIYRKELLDILRDRRTLVAMVVIPVVLYPVLMLAFLRAAESGQAKLESEQFVLEVPDETTRQQMAGILAEVARNPESPDTKPPNVELRVGNTLPTALGDDVHLLVRLSWTPMPSPLPPRVRAEVTYNEVNARSRTAMEQLSDVLKRYRELLARQSISELLARAMPAAPPASEVDLLLRPVDVKTVSTATERQRGGWALGQIVPVILVLMTITGAVYPAIDLTAGERERGTLETLMVTPVPTLYLIVGKFLVVATVGLITAALNVASVGFTMHFSGLTRALATEAPMQLPLSVLPIVLLCLIPFAVLFAAILLAVCSFARTFKEAQNYVMPVIILALVPAFAMTLPGVRLERGLLVLPVGNMVLLTRELFQQTYTLTQVIVVVLSTTLYAAAAVAVASRLFGQEAVLFADSRSYRTLLQRRYFLPAPRPGAAQALLLAALLFPASFYAQSLVANATGESFVRLMGWLSVVQFAVLFVLLPLGLALYTRTDPVETFRLRWPRPAALLGALLIGCSTWALADAFAWLQQKWLAPSQALEEFSRRMEAQLSSAGLGTAVLLMAVVPAIAEEFFFRGFLLSGLRTALRKWPAIVVAAVIFGVFHFVIDRLPVTALIGILLGYICWESRSLLPGIIVHAMHNTAMVLVVMLPAVRRWIEAHTAASGRPQGSIILAAAGLLAVGVWLVHRAGRAAEQSPPATLPLGSAPVLEYNPRP